MDYANELSLWNWSLVYARYIIWPLYINIGSGNDLMPAANKPLHEPMLTHIYVAIWRN